MTRISLVLLLAACTLWGLLNESEAAAQPPDSTALSVSEKLRTVYREAARIAQGDNVTLGELNAILQPVAAEVPTVQVGTENSKPVWNTLTLNSAGQRFDVVRFRSPLDEPADMFWTFGTTGQNVGRWYILPAQGEMRGFQDVETESNLDFDEASLPEPNRWVLQRLIGGEIKPGQEYLLWFLAAEPKPRKVHLAICLVPTSKSPHAVTAREIGRTIGITLPGPVETAGSIVPRGDLKRTGGVQFTPDGQLLAYCGLDQTIKSWDRSTNSWQPFLRPAPARYGTYFVVDPEQKYLVTGGDGGRFLEVWDFSKRVRVGTIPAILEMVRGMRFTPDGKILACFWVGGADEINRRGVITFWEMSTQSECGRIEFDDRGAGGTFVADGSTLIVTSGKIAKREGNAVWSGEQYMDIFAVPGGKRLATFEGIQDSSSGLALTRDSRQMFTVEGYRNLLFWDFPQRKVKSVASVAHWIWDIDLAPDEQRLALAMSDGTVRLWDVAAKRTVAIWYGHTNRVREVAFSPDGKLLVSGDGQTPRIWPVPPRPKAYEHPACGYPEGTLTNSLGMKLVPVPAGRFLMGADDRDSLGKPDERPAHRVKIAAPFFLSAHEVTVGQFRQFVEATGYRTTAETNKRGGSGYDIERLKFLERSELNWRNPGFPQGEDHPVVHITWGDAQQFCKWLSEKEREVYRLPTEAEWEYACRAGTQTPWPWGDQAYGLLDMANAADQALRVKVANKQYWSSMGNWNDGFAYTAPVGSFLPNAFGLYDMHGNVSEWCEDRYSRFADQQASQGTSADSVPGDERVHRGGAFWYSASGCRSASRDRDTANGPFDCCGFRPARNVSITSEEPPQ